MKRLILISIVTLFVVGGTILSAQHQKKCIKNEIALIQKTYPKATSIRSVNVEDEDETQDYDALAEMFFTIESWFSHPETYEATLPKRDQAGCAPYVCAETCMFKVVNGKAEKYMWGDVVFE